MNPRVPTYHGRMSVPILVLHALNHVRGIMTVQEWILAWQFTCSTKSWVSRNINVGSITRDANVILAGDVKP